MKIKIYGTGCPKCRQLAENVQTAADAVGSDIDLEKVTDINAIVAAGVMTTPTLELDGKIVSSGKVLSPVEIAKMLPQGESSCGCGCNCHGGDSKTESSESSCCCGGSGTKKAKGALTALLLLFVFAALAVVIMRETKSSAAAKENAEAAASAEATSAAKDTLTVYYFHGTQRCMKCNKIEQLTREAIEGKYADALKDGSVVFNSINLDEPEHGHFIQDFQLTIRSVVMTKGGKYEKFDGVWSLVGDREKFIAYIQEGAARMAGGKE